MPLWADVAVASSSEDRPGSSWGGSRVCAPTRRAATVRPAARTLLTRLDGYNASLGSRTYRPSAGVPLPRVASSAPAARRRLPLAVATSWCYAGHDTTAPRAFEVNHEVRPGEPG